MNLFKNIKNKIIIREVKSYLKEIESVSDCHDLQYKYYTTRFNFGLIEQQLKKINKESLSLDEIDQIKTIKDKTNTKKNMLSKCSVWTEHWW